MKHLNNDVACAIVAHTTGPAYDLHDIFELAVLPLRHDLTVDNSIIPFHTYMLPKHPDTCNIRKLGGYFKSVMAGAFDPWTGVSLFEKWYAKLKLRDNKRIVPVVWDWSSQAPFIQAWFGYHADGCVIMDEYIRRGYARDLSTLPLYWNDVAWTRDEYVPYIKQYLRYAGVRMGVTFDPPGSALQKAKFLAETYKAMTRVDTNPTLTLPIDYGDAIDYAWYEDQKEIQELWSEWDPLSEPSALHE